MSFSVCTSATCRPPSGSPRHEPSPEEILAECRSIQSTWTEDERLRRERGELGAWHERCSKLTSRKAGVTC